MDIRSQSAMEYLMTYGWSILILAVVIAALYYLGVFNTTSAQSNVCLGITGYTCQNPILYASGQLNVTLGQIGQAITVTNTYCTSNSAPPQNAGSGNLNIHVYQDQNAQIQFQCPLTSTAIGTQFSGYIWIVYNTGTQTGIVQEVGAVKASVIAGGSGPNSAYGYVPITITNSQSTATGSDFQEMVTVDSATYGNYINSGWQNVEFTTGSQYSSGGTPIYAWVESNPSNTASSTTVWLLLPGGIAADSSTTVYMNFMTNNVMASSTSFTGEAPQLSPSYAQYDNGGKVFNDYWNFSGTTLPSGWFNGGSYTVSQNNGLTLSGTGGFFVYTSPFSYPYISESYGKATVAGTGFWSYLLAESSVNTGAISTWTGVGFTPAGTQFQYSNLFTTTGISSLNTFYLFTDAVSSSSSYFYEDYNLLGNQALTEPYIALYEHGSIIVTQWVRIRAYPPSGIMPTATFGAMAS